MSPRRPAAPRRPSPPPRGTSARAAHPRPKPAAPSDRKPEATSSSRPAPRPEPDPEPSAPAPERTRPARGKSPSAGGVVLPADRFRDLVRARPWRRRRRTVLLSVLGALVLVIGLGIAAITLPQLQVHRVEVEGTSYVDPAAVKDAASGAREGSVLLTRTGKVADRVEEVPGVAGADVERDWPDGLRITVTETEPVATLRKADGDTTILAADGTELPAAAGKGRKLASLTVDSDAQDAAGARTAMLDVLASMPSSMRSQVGEVTAGTRSDVSFTIQPKKGSAKTIVWGDADDADLKAEVVRALLDAPGSVIDVSSPVAPVTR